MKLKKLLQMVPLNLASGNKDVEITGMTSHSKYVHPGALFVAKKGHIDDGSKYIEEAISSGAAAILSDMANPFLKVAQLVHPNPSEIEAKLAASYYQNPSKELFTIAVTGTSGKTTITTILKHLLDELDVKTGLIGSIEHIIGDIKRPAEKNTTPDVISNHKMLREMVNAGCTAVALEVTSHSLVQGRVREIDFDLAVFTNLSHDHLDYHQTMENYAAAKQTLFTSLGQSKHAVINCDSPFAELMVKNCKAKILTYGFSEKADIRCLSASMTPYATSFEVAYKGKKALFHWNLIGKHNVLNALAAIAVLIVRGVEFSSLPTLLTKAPSVSGRLERVGDSLVFVDYAHKPDALEKVLTFLREIKKGKLITVFGCGGDRDQKKRPIMATISEKLSDLTIVTSDNPRSENPMDIISDIVKGFSKTNYQIEPDRRKAIEKAIKTAEKDDLILIAGKGHETYQIFSHQTIGFDDRKVALEFLENK